MAPPPWPRTDFWFPNGLVITDDGTLIVAETFAARFAAFYIQLDGSLTTGALGRGRTGARAGRHGNDALRRHLRSDGGGWTLRATCGRRMAWGRRSAASRRAVRSSTKSRCPRASACSPWAWGRGRPHADRVCGAGLLRARAGSSTRGGAADDDGRGPARRVALSEREVAADTWGIHQPVDMPRISGDPATSDGLFTNWFTRRSRAGSRSGIPARSAVCQRPVLGSARQAVTVAARARADVAVRA